MTDERTTSHGTPWATTWDEAWAARVEGAESALGRRICGARTLSGDPCTLGSDHPTGRCRYHGGTDAIGAPIGNQNARTHGLYARRLQRCGTHCPMWEHCPFAGDDVLALEPRDRPICAYEAEEYAAVLAGVVGAGCTSTDDDESDCGDARQTLPRQNLALPNDRDELTTHNLALMQVMLSRAAAALSVTTLIDTTTSEGEQYQLHSTKMHPALQAFLRINRELRATLNDTRRAAYLASARDRAACAKQSNDGTDAATPDDPSWFAQVDDAVLERAAAVGQRRHEAASEREEYMRRLEWIAHDNLGENWREFESIREFAVPRGVRDPGVPTHDPLVSTPHPPPSDHPPPLRDTESAQYAQPP